LDEAKRLKDMANGIIKANGDIDEAIDYYR